MKFDLSKINFSIFDLKRGLKLPNELNEGLAEDLGIMVGDGYIGKLVRLKRAADYYINCYGNAITDRRFYGEYVKNLKKSLFNLDFRFSNKKKNTCELKINSKGLLEFYTKVCGLPSGKKVGIGIPLIVKDSNENIKCSFIRGLADSDFSLTFRRKGKKIMYYPLIRIKTSSKNLILDLELLLNKMGFKITTSYDLKSRHPVTNNISIGHELSLNGVSNLEFWMEKIGFSNPKNLLKLLKYNLWKTNGFCEDDLKIREIMMGPMGFEFVRH